MAPEIIPIEVSADEGMCARSDNHYLSFVMKPNYRNPNSDCMADFPRINSHGLRDRERSVDKPKNTRRIILLGDSVVVGFGVRRIQDLMSQRLERMYADEGEDVEVLNVATIGYCTRSEVELLRVKGLPFQPDRVVLVFVENDFDNFNRQVRGLGGERERPEIVNGLYRQSHLFRMASLQLNWFGYGAEADPLKWNHDAVGENNVVDGLRVLEALADAHRFDVIVAVWPTFLNDRIIDKPKMFLPQSDQLIIEELAHSHGFPVFRLAQHFTTYWKENAPQENPRLTYTTDDEMHPSEEGHRVAALLLKKALNGEGLILPGAHGSMTAEHAETAARSLGDEQPNYAIDMIEKAKELNRAGEADEALKTYRQVIEMNPKYAVDAHTEIGVILAARGNFQDAIEHFRKSLAQKPDYHIAHTNLANVLLGIGEVDQAIDHYMQAVGARPEYGPAHNNLGVALQAKGRIHEALPHLQKAVELSPNNPAIHRALGKALLQANQPTEAIVYLNNVLKLRHESSEVHFHLGKAYRQTRQYGESLAHLLRARELAPGNAVVHNSLGVTYIQMGRINDAIAAFERAVKIDPRLDMARRNLNEAQRQPIPQ